MATTDIFNLSNMQQSTDWNVDPKTQTVAGQLNSVIASDSPLIQQARQRAMEGMSSRGLSNSSMATGAADSAVYDTALKIATPDAMTFADAAKTNAGTKNQFALQNNSITGQTNAANWGAQQDFGRQTARDATQQGYTQANMVLGTQQDIQKMGVQQGFDITKMGIEAANALKQMTAQQQNDLAKMATSQGYNLQTMTAQQINDLAKMNLGQTFDITKMGIEAANALKQMTAQQQNDLAKMATSQGYNLQTMTAQQVNQLQQMQAAQTNNLQTLATQQGFDLTKMDAQTANTLKTMTTEQQNRMAQLATQNGYDLGKMNLQQTLDLAKLDVQTAAAIEVADIEAVYKNLTQGSTAATSILNKMQDSLNALNAKDGLTAESRNALARDIKTNAMESLNLVGAIAGDVDLSQFINTVGL